MILPALSLRQPWAWLVVHGGKDIENRVWTTKLRGAFLIHASKGMTPSEWLAAKQFARGAGFSGELPRGDAQLQRGGIIGAARIKHVYAPGRPLSPWHMADQYGFALANVTPLPFRAYSGRQRWFNVELTDAETDALVAAGLLIERTRLRMQSLEVEYEGSAEGAKQLMGAVGKLLGGGS